MILLDRFLAKSKSPYRREDIADLMAQHGDKIRVLTRINPKGEVGAFALLTVPIPMCGHQVSTIIAAGTDGTLDARALFQELKSAARTLGADQLIVNTWRNPQVMVKRFGATIDSVTLRWDLTSPNGRK